MKKSLLATAAVAAIAVVASSAQAESIGGYVGANYARTQVDVPGPNPDLNSYQLEGATQFHLGAVNTLLQGEVTAVGGDDFNDFVDYAFTGHLNGDLGGALVGGFGGVYATTDLTVWSLGLEGQASLAPNVTLYGQAGYGYSDQLDNASLWAVRGELRYYVNDNVKLQGQGGWSTVDTDNVGSYDTWTLGVGGEYQFAGTPWSILASYDYANSDDLDVKSNTFRIGGRYTFGGATLKAREAAGADLGSVRKLFTGVTGF